MTTIPSQKPIAQNLTISSSYAGQRIDNFLFNKFKNIPKTRIYKALRKGEVRTNGKRTQPLYKLKSGDVIRIPPPFLTQPISQKKKSNSNSPLSQFLKRQIIYEDNEIFILNKPSGLAVHGGSNIQNGIIETLKTSISPAIELAHRLDRETSGCLIVAKKRRVLKELHHLLEKRKVKKTYFALLKGQLKKSEYKIDFPLKRKENATSRSVQTHPEGKPALSIFKPLHRFKEATWVEVELHTGRMHQIRAHASAFGHPIAGDDKYGDKDFNQLMQKKGLKRLALHAAILSFTLPSSDKKIQLCACLDSQLLELLEQLKNE